MLIRYDKEVIAHARKLASSPSSTRTDIFRILSNDVDIPQVRNKHHLSNMPIASFLGKEARREIIRIAMSVPRKRN